MTREASPPGPAGSARPVAALQVDDARPIRAVDLHVDTPWRVHFKGRPTSNPEGPATIERLREGRYAGIVYPIYIPDYLHDDHPTIADADAIYDTIDKLVAEHEALVYAEEIAPPGTVPEDRIAIFVSIEGAGAFADDVTQIDRFVRRGVRLVGPVHARDNRLGGAATGKQRGGLTELGKQFCERVYAAGALVDVSHLSDAGFDDLVPIAKRFGAPVVATHSNARARHDHRRNLTDAQLRVIAATGGVAGLNLHRGFLAGQKLPAIVAMVKHMVAVAGVDHVALGTDFEGGTPPSGLRDASRMPELAKALIKARMSESDVRKIFATNALRILKWQAASR
ncbi:MAG: membrane dipeptidase [Deltaproteobacteria bacterium]|nr:membrane dipeptidase [Deltaproteobacteria bacterium]